jgi:septal ring factor EnvC (AmiA/AmiB activator)
VQTIRKDKKKYAAEIRAKEKESRNIDRKIERVIREAIAEANRRTAKKTATESKETTAAAEKATKSTRATETNKIVLTKEGKIVSDNFTANKGRLPWPVEKGFISSGFGKHQHPYIDNVQINNLGVDVTTESGAPVRAVFGGEVSSVQKLRTGNYIVCIQHGNYFTVYSNLDNVSVGPGDKVSINSRIGTVGDDPEGRPVLKFMITKNTTPLNPAQWIAR